MCREQQKEERNNNNESSVIKHKYYIIFLLVVPFLVIVVAIFHARRSMHRQQQQQHTICKNCNCDTTHEARRTRLTRTRFAMLLLLLRLREYRNCCCNLFDVDCVEAERACASHVHSLRCLPNECEADVMCCCDSAQPAHSARERADRERECNCESAQLRVRAIR